MEFTRLISPWCLLCLFAAPLVRADETRAGDTGRSRSISWYLYGGTSGDYDDDLLAESVPAPIETGFSFSVESVDAGTTTLAGLGGIFCLNERFALDFGLSHGTSSLDSIVTLRAPRFDGGIEVGTDVRRLELNTDLEIFEGHLTGRFYPRKCCRLRPWVAAGLRGASLRPTGLTEEQRFLLSGNLDGDVNTLEALAGFGLDVQLSDRFDLGLSAEQGFDTGQRFGIRLVLKMGSGGCGGRCTKRDGAAPEDDEPLEPDGDNNDEKDDKDKKDEEDPACGSFLPGQAKLPRIAPPPLLARRPVRLAPAALPAGARAFYPAWDGDRFFVHFPDPAAGRGAGRSTADLLDEIVAPTLRAVGFDAGASALQLPPPAGVEVPGADLAALAEAAALEAAADRTPPSPATVALLEALLGERPADAATDAELEGSLGMSFAELEADVTRTETLYPFQQIHAGVPIEHTLLLASRRAGEGATSLRGALIRDYQVANSDTVASPVATARQAMRQVPGVQDVELPAGGDGPTLVLLPYGSGPDGRIQLRYAYRMILVARFCGQDLPFLLWLDAADGTLLKLEPLVAEAGAAAEKPAEPVAARARVYNRDPGVGTTETYLQVDPAQDGRYALQDARGLQRVDFQDDGFDDLDVAIAADASDSSSRLANFDQLPINDDAQALCGGGSNKQFQQVHFYSALARYRRYALGLGFEPFFSLAWEPGVESKSMGCGALSSMTFGACEGYYHEDCPSYSDGTSSLDNCMNFAHDNTVIAHEVGHNVTSKLTNWRAFDWCGSEACALPVGWRSLHDLADFWAAHLESTPCVGGWVCKNVGGVDASLGCRSHVEGSDLPRLQELPRPFDADAPGDRFPEHRRIAAGEYADMQIAAAALWELQLGMRSKSRTAGLVPFAPRFTRALRKSGFVATLPEATDLGIYAYLFELENELADEWRATAGHLTSKVTAAFARAGLFLVPYPCLDSDPATGDPDFCPAGDHGGDAVIDVDDNDADDDYQIRGVSHPEVDYLELGGPAPSFHVRTGPRYRFGGDGKAGLTGPAPCNREYRVDVSTDPGFPAAATVDSGWQPVPEAACYGTWAPDPGPWAALQAGGAGTRIYYRVTTRDAGGDHTRISTAPGGGMWIVPPPYVVLTDDGTARF